MLLKDPKPDIILLDDAMQHRWVKPGHLILLTAYHQRYSSDFLLPMGRLREHRSAAARADTIVVTKCPFDLSPSERRMIKDELGPKEHQEVCFSYEDYPGLVELSTGNQVDWKTFTADQALLVTGIADPSTLLSFLENKVEQLDHIAFRDHQDFTASDMERILSQFSMMKGETTLVLTTEKDAQRIVKWMQNEKFASLPVYVILHRMQWFDKDREIIENRLNGFIKAYSGNDSLH
ncbi:MAG: tetraacyldisaccharide 4'-kinase [Flavobacteriales bacterium]|nr:tetraacyldisaccharide 4'-kinase [Flavobacteriales bacterium]